MQILVIVANTQTSILRAEVGKGSMRTAFDHGLVDPKAVGNSNENDFDHEAERESG